MRAEFWTWLKLAWIIPFLVFIVGSLGFALFSWTRQWIDPDPLRGIDPVMLRGTVAKVTGDCGFTRGAGFGKHLRLTLREKGERRFELPGWDCWDCSGYVLAAGDRVELGVDRAHLAAGLQDQPVHFLRVNEIIWFTPDDLLRRSQVTFGFGIIAFFVVIPVCMLIVYRKILASKWK